MIAIFATRGDGVLKIYQNPAVRRSVVSTRGFVLLPPQRHVDIYLDGKKIELMIVAASYPYSSSLSGSHTTAPHNRNYQILVALVNMITLLCTKRKKPKNNVWKIE